MKKFREGDFRGFLFGSSVYRPTDDDFNRMNEINKQASQRAEAANKLVDRWNGLDAESQNEIYKLHAPNESLFEISSELPDWIKKSIIKIKENWVRDMIRRGILTNQDFDNLEFVHDS